MHKKGTAVRQRQKAAPALTALPSTGGSARSPPHPGPPPPAAPLRAGTRSRDAEPGRSRLPYLRRRCPHPRVAPGGGAAVVIHEEGPARLRVDLDLPAGGQRLGAALHLRRRRGVRGGAHGGPGPGPGPDRAGFPMAGGGAGPAALSAAGRGGGGAGLEVSGNGGAGGGGGGGTRDRGEGRGGGGTRRSWPGWKLLVVSSTARLARG